MAGRIGRLAQHVVGAPGPSPSGPSGPSSPSLTTSLAQAGCSGGIANGELLKGIRVIELATVIAAPAACAQLADLGADVIKIESPKSPDMSRAWGHNDESKSTADPELLKALKARKGGGGSAYVQINRGKRSVLVDFQQPEGVAILKKLMATADVFVTNVRLQGLKKVGLDFEAVHKEFPHLIYAHFTAFGRSGPRVNDPGYDYGAFWQNTGIGDLVRESDNADVVRVPSGIGDNAVATQLAGWIGMALYHRELTGEGQLVDATLFRAGVAALTQLLVQHSGGSPFAHSQGSIHARSVSTIGRRSTNVTNAHFLCKDGVRVQLLGEEMRAHVQKTLKALGVTPKELYGMDKPVWKEVDFQAATAKVDEAIRTKTYAEWKPIFAKHDIWHVVVNRFEDMMEDEQVKATKMVVDVPGLQHPLMRGPIYMGSDKGEPQASAPHFGQHTDDVLTEIGYDKQAVTKMRSEGVVG